MRIRLQSALLLGALLFVAAGCGDKPVAPYPKSTPVPDEQLGLGPGDVFEVRVFGEVELSGTYQVGPDGTISFPLIGEIVVAGRSPGDVEDEIRTRLADGYLRQPQVSIFVKEARSKRISVVGQVRQPGTFPYTRDMSIIEAISTAGGFTALAKKNSVSVIRVEDGARERIYVAVEDISRGKAPNFILRPGDVVTVPERAF